MVDLDRIGRLAVQKRVDLTDAVGVLGQRVADADAVQKLLRPRPDVVGAGVGLLLRALLQDPAIHAMMAEGGGGGEPDRSRADDDHVGVIVCSCLGVGHDRRSL